MTMLMETPPIACSSIVTDSHTSTTSSRMQEPPPKRKRVLALPYYDSDGGTKQPVEKQDLSEHNGHCYTKARDGSSLCDGFSQGALRRYGKQ